MSEQNYPRQEYILTHTNLLLRYTHERPDSQYLMAKGERYDFATKAWVSHPIGIGYYQERSFPCTAGRAAEIVAS